jgi:hypothetical protein
MNKEQLRMQMLSGIITEGEYKAKLKKLNSTKEKNSLNENCSWNCSNWSYQSIPSREKADYETAFEHFLGQKYELNEEMEEVEEGNLDEENLNEADVAAIKK